MKAMNSDKIKIYTTFLLFLSMLHVVAQGLNVGQPMPDITFRQLVNTDQQELSLSSLKGKNVILYTWAVYCAPCIEKFPALNKLRDDNKEDLEIIMLSGDEYSRVVRIFDNQRSIGRNITLTQAVLSKEDWEQLALSKEDGYGGSIWIDKEGIYQGSAVIDEENVTYFVQYGKPKALKFANYAKVIKNFDPVDNVKRQENFAALKEYDPNKPLLFAQDGSNIRSGTIFTGYNPNYPDNPPIKIITKDGKPIGIRIVNARHHYLYSFANIQTYEVNASNATLTPKKTRKIQKDFKKQTSKEIFEINRFNMDSLLITDGLCYELILSDKSAKEIPTLLAYMRNDLDRYFGLNSHIEMRKCLALVEIEKSRTNLKSQYKNPNTQRDNFGVLIRNGNIDYLISAISYYYLLAGKGEYAYILNHTGIDYNIDVEITAEMTNLASIKNALNKVGLDLIETEPIGEVCVIKDH